jgi:hypothetical protein
LVILDACRYDLFRDNWDYPGELQRRTSRASATAEFLFANFDGCDLRDTVYVTASPQLYRNEDKLDCTFHSVVNVWSEDGWNENLGTVKPETVTKYAKRAVADYPDKRLIVHYIQPHFPFIQSDTDFDKGHLDKPVSEREDNMWIQMMKGNLAVSRNEVWQLYQDNLLTTLPHVYDLLDETSGKSVVTADHGNIIGERAFPIPIREWGHPRGIYTEELVTVPWLVHNSGQRRSIKPSEPVRDTTDIEDSVVEDRLEQLGYKQ